MSSSRKKKIEITSRSKSAIRYRGQNYNGKNNFLIN